MPRAAAVRAAPSSTLPSERRRRAASTSCSMELVTVTPDDGADPLSAARARSPSGYVQLGAIGPDQALLVPPDVDALIYHRPCAHQRLGWLLCRDRIAHSLVGQSFPWSSRAATVASLFSSAEESAGMPPPFPVPLIGRADRFGYWRVDGPDAALDSYLTLPTPLGTFLSQDLRRCALLEVAATALLALGDVAASDDDAHAAYGAAHSLSAAVAATRAAARARHSVPPEMVGVRERGIGRRRGRRRHPRRRRRRRCVAWLRAAVRDGAAPRRVRCWPAGGDRGGRRAPTILAEEEGSARREEHAACVANAARAARAGRGQ